MQVCPVETHTDVDNDDATFMNELVELRIIRTTIIIYRLAYDVLGLVQQRLYIATLTIHNGTPVLHFE